MTRHAQHALGTIPARAGIGLRAAHYAEVLARKPRVGFFEVHSENFFGAGGRHLEVLDAVRGDYPVSLHGVGLSLGSSDPINPRHLERLAHLIERCDPVLVSEHLCWSMIDGQFLNDLLPLPYTEAALAHMVARISAVQERLGRRIALENVSSYLEFASSTIPEWDFLRLLAERAGCGILLDVNNVYVAAVNHGFDPYVYLDAMPVSAVAEIHLGGHTPREIDGQPLLIDTHDQYVADDVWALYAYAVRRFGPVPTLIEWDTDLPPLRSLVLEARRADCIMENLYELAA